jgi:hypothetical protein
MVQNGTISASEGASLLEASEARPMRSTSSTVSHTRWLKVRVTDLATGRSKTNVSIPIGLVEVGLRMGARFAPEMVGVDMDEVLATIKDGANGKLVDVEDVEKGEHVEIQVE